MDIIQWPDPRLKQVASPIDLLKADVGELGDTIEQMVSLMFRDGGVGLAATQVGWMSRAFVMRFDVGDDCERNRGFLNPKILRAYGDTTTDIEGCLSAKEAPPLPVVRWDKVDLQWSEIVDGEIVEFEETLSGYNARVAQHEIGHLDGQMYWDNVSSSLRKRALKVYPAPPKTGGLTKEQIMEKRRKRKKRKR